MSTTSSSQKKASENLALLFVSAMSLGIRPQGYYREAGKKLSRNSKGFAGFVDAESKYIRGKLMSSFIAKMRSSGAPAGVKVKFDPYKMICDRTYRESILRVKGVQARKASDVLRGILSDIDASYTTNSEGARAVVEKLKTKKKVLG